MDLFTLVASLTLEKKEYDDSLEQAKKAGEELPDVTAKAKLDGDEYKQSLGTIEGDTEEFGTHVGTIFDGMGKKLATLGLAAAVAGIAKSLSVAVVLAGQLGDSVDKGSTRL